MQSRDFQVRLTLNFTCLSVTFYIHAKVSSRRLLLPLRLMGRFQEGYLLLSGPKLSALYVSSTYVVVIVKCKLSELHETDPRYYDNEFLKSNI